MSPGKKQLRLVENRQDVRTYRNNSGLLTYCPEKNCLETAAKAVNNQVENSSTKKSDTLSTVQVDNQRSEKKALLTDVIDNKGSNSEKKSRSSNETAKERVHVLGKKQKAQRSNVCRKKF